jgi:hypothetical protein
MVSPTENVHYTKKIGVFTPKSIKKADPFPKGPAST